MKKVFNGTPAQTTKTATTTLDQIQQQVLEVCQPHYHEYHRATTEHGFTTITFPRQRRK